MYHCFKPKLADCYERLLFALVGLCLTWNLTFSRLFVSMTKPQIYGSVHLSKGSGDFQEHTGAFQTCSGIRNIAVYVYSKLPGYFTAL